MPEYTVLTALAVLAVIVAELVYFKSGIFRTAQYWWSMVIIFAFQIPVDGWLTKLSAPIVIYNPEEILGLRAPWDIPIEDFGFRICHGHARYPALAPLAGSQAGTRGGRSTVTMITSEDVATAFDEVAPRYDLMVALNPGYHAHLRSAAHALVEWLPRPALRSAAPPRSHS